MQKKMLLYVCAVGAGILSCVQDPPSGEQLSDKIVLNGSWKLMESKVIVGDDTTVTFPVEGQEMIKVFNDTHFAFFKHDVSKGKTNAVFDAGAGTYSLKGSDYTEELEYCNYRGWEGHRFSFKLTLRGDTLVQTGIEKIDSLNVNQEITEVYKRATR